MSNYEQKAQETCSAARRRAGSPSAATCCFVVGIFHVIDGIAALSKAHVYAD